MKRKWYDRLWDVACVASIIGIWPRFVEPNLLRTTALRVPLKHLPKQLNGLRIVQFSDLHLNSRMSKKFLAKILKRIQKLSPDIVVFTGDFLCYSQLDDAQRLKNFLNQIHAPGGCFAVWGNHDYEQAASINDQGDYDIIDGKTSTLAKGLRRLLPSSEVTGKITNRLASVCEHQKLRELLDQTPFQLLNNNTLTVQLCGAAINLCGVGEHMLGKCHPDLTFRFYNEKYPGIVLAHNPDCIPILKQFPGDVILCGHTHGAQVNLPWMWKRFMSLENLKFKRGVFQLKDKWIYINRGVASAMPFRWLSIPEILVLTLSSG